MGTVLATLATIALSFGAQWISDKISNMKAKRNKVTSDDVLNIVKDITSAARTKGNQTLNQVYDRINAIQFPYSMGSAVKQYMVGIKRDLAKTYNNARDQYAVVEQKLNNIDDRTSHFASQSDSVRNMMKGTVNLLKNEAVEGAKDVNKIITGVENKL